MSFLLPILSAAGPLIGKLAGAAGTAALGNAAAKEGGVGALSGVPNGVVDATANQIQQMKGLGTEGNNSTASGLGDLDTAGNFYKTVLGGSQEESNKLLQPQVTTVMNQYDNAVKAATELGPRGGGRTNAIEAAKTGKAGAYGNLLGSVLPGAAAGVAGVGGEKAKVGAQQTNQSLSGFNTELKTQYDAGQAAAKRIGDLGSSIGGSLGSALSSLGRVGSSSGSSGYSGGGVDPNYYQNGGFGG